MLIMVLIDKIIEKPGNKNMICNNFLNQPILFYLYNISNCKRMTYICVCILWCDLLLHGKSFQKHFITSFAYQK